MAQISVFLASWVITCIHKAGMRSVLDLALLCMAKTLTIQGHGALHVPSSPCCARTLDARGALIRLGLVQLRVGTQSRDARSGLLHALLRQLSLKDQRSTIFAPSLWGWWAELYEDKILGRDKVGRMGQISWWEAGQCLADLGFRLGFVELGLSLDWALLGWVWALLVHGMRKGKGSWLEAGRRSGAVPAEQPGGDSIREVLMTQQQQQQKRKGGKGRKGSCRAGCHGDPKEVWTSPALFTAAFEPRRELWLAIKGDMWPFAHRDRPLQLRVFSSFSPLSPPAIIHSDLRKKRKKKKNLGQVVHPLPWGPIPAGQTATSFSPLFPPTAMCRPHFLCSYEILLCSELINSSRCLLSHQPLHRNSLHKEGGLKTFSRGAAGSCLPQLGLSGGIWLTKCQKLEWKG